VYMVWLRWRRLAWPGFHLIPAPSTSSPFFWTKTADHLRGSAGDKLGLVRRDRPPYPPEDATSAALCGETDPRTRLKTPHPRPCAERRTPPARSPEGNSLTAH
jgi:hypothetical protein